MMKKLIRKKAFSLIELSVVIVIIAVLVSAVVASDHLVRSSRVAAARSVTLSSQIVTIPGMVVWYETTTKESFPVGQNFDGAQITTWYNREPSNFLEKNNLTTTASNAVVYKERSINNLPAVRFASGTMALADFTGGVIAQPITTVVVFKPGTALTSTGQVIFDSGDSAVVFAFRIDEDSVDILSPTTVTEPFSFALGQPYIGMTVFNGTSSAIYINDTTAVSGSLNPGTNSMEGITIGSNRVGASNFNGDIAEVIVFNRGLKETERYDVMSYLSKKYKISVTGL